MKYCILTYQEIQYSVNNSVTSSIEEQYQTVKECNECFGGLNYIQTIPDEILMSYCKNSMEKKADRF